MVYAKARLSWAMSGVLRLLLGGTGRDILDPVVGT